MFGYIVINKAEMKFKDYDVYHSYYCGLCKTLQEKYGRAGQMTLNFDLTFLLILLTGLYEPGTEQSASRCIVHPFRKHPTRINEFSEYVADMNILMSYYKCKDDWEDEKKYTRYACARLLKPKCRRIEANFPEKLDKIESLFKELSKGEKQQEGSIDKMAGLFGEIMAEVFAYKEDEWESGMRRIGFFLGKFIYLMDAYEDIEEDMGKGMYNPFYQLYEKPGFDTECQKILTMMMAECAGEFEKLPILEDVEILRNILYSGVWCRYETVKMKREEKQVKKDD